MINIIGDARERDGDDTDMNRIGAHLNKRQDIRGIINELC